MSVAYVDASVMAATAFGEQDPGKLLLSTLDGRQCTVGTAFDFATLEGLYSP